MQITTALQSDARTPVRRRGGGAGRRPGACPDAARGITTIVVPQAAGGAVDIGARAMAEFLSTAKATRSEEHTSELQSHSEISYAVFCLKKKK